MQMTCESPVHCVYVILTYFSTNHQYFLPIKSRSRESPDSVNCQNNNAMLCLPPFSPPHTKEKNQSGYVRLSSWGEPDSLVFLKQQMLHADFSIMDGSLYFIQKKYL